MRKFILMSALALSLTLHAQETKEVSGPLPATETTIKLAAELSKYGYANKSALALIQAAQIAVENNFQEVAAQKDNAEATQTTGDKKGNITLDPKQLLEDAAVLADGDANLLALIAKASETQSKRAPVGGSSYNSTSVNGNGTDVYTVSFIAGQTAVVTVVGDGDTDLDLYVYDSNGNLIVKDDDYTDNCAVSWTPKWTGKFKIKVVNRGPVYNRYIIRMR